MKRFVYGITKDGLLESVRGTNDPYNTVYLNALGGMCLPDGVTGSFSVREEEERLLLTYTVKNDTKIPVSPSDIRFLIDANNRYGKDAHTNYFGRVLQKSCICGHGSFIYFVRPCGKGPHLLLIATEDTALSGEYNTAPYSVSPGGKDLAPGQKQDYTFTLLWIDREEDIQKALYEQGTVSLAIFPGLTVPSDTELLLAPKCKAPINGLFCPDAEISPRDGGMYALRFLKRGEHTVRIVYGEGHETIVECFSTRPVEELIKMRAAHITEYQQYRGEQWYDGLFSQWSAKERRMTTPDDPMELLEYMVCADDPGLCKAPYLAEKNVFRPDPKEIEAIEYYIEHFVWGKLQRREDEHPHPYGIYGSVNWKKNKESQKGYDSGGVGKERMWRTFDYTHLIQLYYNMYLIAKNYPSYIRYLDAQGYLNRARRTALAYFEVPYSIFMHTYWDHHGYCDWAFKQGNFHERYILPLLDICKDETLRAHWEAKCRYMIYDTALPYGSEMLFDSTAFESTQAVARYMLTEAQWQENAAWYDRNLKGPGQGGYRSYEKRDPLKEETFLHSQMAANLACRGTQARSFYHLGSDYRAGGYKSYLMSYMSQMGGAAVLDYALCFDEDPFENLRIGYASLLSCWALVNLGTEDPYYPHKENQGAVGWAWQPEEGGRCWDFMNCARGPWPYDGEIDSGLSGAICASCSVLAKDPTFGLVCYGGRVSAGEERLTIYPNDGVRKAFHALHRLPQRLHVSLDRDAFCAITLEGEGERLVFDLENITGDAHQTVLTVNGTAYPLDIPKGVRCTVVYTEKNGAVLLL